MRIALGEYAVQDNEYLGRIRAFHGFIAAYCGQIIHHWLKWGWSAEYTIGKNSLKIIIESKTHNSEVSLILKSNFGKSSLRFLVTPMTSAFFTQCLEA